MTTTRLGYFDKTPGTLEQLVLAVITQKLINRDYVPQLLETDFTSNSITYSVTSDSGDNNSNTANLSISLTFPTLPYARQILTDKNSFDERVMSINSLNVDTLSLPQKPSYPLKSFPAQLPDYLNQAVPQNILERRLMALCLHIRNYRNWVERWNRLTVQWQFRTYAQHWGINTEVTYAEYEALPLNEIVALRDDLLLELSSIIQYKKQTLSGILAAFPFGEQSGNPASAQELIKFLDPPVIDPANNQSPMSESLLDDLDSSSYSSSSGGFGGQPPKEPEQQKPPEKPTLPNC